MNLISAEGAVKATFSCKTSELLAILKFLRAAIPKRIKVFQRIMEVTIKTNQVSFVVAGASKTLVCVANGPAKFTMSFPYFYDMVSTTIKSNSDISVGDWFMMFNGSTIHVETCFFQDYSILKSIDLPMNYTVSDILRLSLQYTEEEIEFNKLNEEQSKAYKALANDTQLVVSKLKKYGFSQIEIEKFIHDKIFNKN